MIFLWFQPMCNSKKYASMRLATSVCRGFFCKALWRLWGVQNQALQTWHLALQKLPFAQYSIRWTILFLSRIKGKSHLPYMTLTVKFQLISMNLDNCKGILLCDLLIYRQAKKSKWIHHFFKVNLSNLRFSFIGC